MPGAEWGGGRIRSGTSEAAGSVKAWKNTSPRSWAAPQLLMSGKLPTPYPPRAPQIIHPQPPSQTQSAKPATMLENTSPDSSHLACGLASQIFAALRVRERAGMALQVLLTEFWLQAHSQTTEPNLCVYCPIRGPGDSHLCHGAMHSPYLSWTPRGSASPHHTSKEGVELAGLYVQLCVTVSMSILTRPLSSLVNNTVQAGRAQHYGSLSPSCLGFPLAGDKPHR